MGCFPTRLRLRSVDSYTVGGREVYRAQLTIEKDREGEELCSFTFKMTFGSKILLENTHLSLLRGSKYGLVGANGVGKITLLSSIASGRLEGLPEELRTVFVESNVGSSGETSSCST